MDAGFFSIIEEAGLGDIAAEAGIDLSMAGQQNGSSSHGGASIADAAHMLGLSRGGGGAG